MSYLKDVYNNASGYQTSIGTGSIETGAILAGTIAVTGEVTVNNTTGNAIVAGIHNGSKILKGSNGDGLMLFAGAKGIEQTTETFTDGGETKTITKVNNATTEIYSDGSAKFGNDISGIRIDAEGNVSMGFVDYDSFNAVTEFKHNDSITVTPFKPNIHVVNMKLGSKLANNVLNVNIDCPENQNGIMKMTVVNSSSYEICLKFSEEYYLAVGQKFIMPYNTVQEFIINQKTIYPVGGFDPYYKITANGTLFDAPGVKHMRNLYPTVVSGAMAYFPLLSMMNLTGECSLTTPANKHLYIKAHLLSSAIISDGSIDSIGDAEGVYTRTFSGALGC
jgi:hypothetical protein